MALVSNTVRCLGQAAESQNTLLAYYTPILIKALGFDQPIQSQGILVGKYVLNFICAMTGGLIVERVGRRNLVLWGASSTLLGCTLFTIISVSRSLFKVA